MHAIQSPDTPLFDPVVPRFDPAVPRYSQREPVNKSSNQSSGRRGLCHISQVLELIFQKYGIETEQPEPSLHSGGEAAALAKAAPVQSVQESSSVDFADQQEVKDRNWAAENRGTGNWATVQSAATNASQGTFSWYQPGELTI